MVLKTSKPPTGKRSRRGTIISFRAGESVVLYSMTSGLIALGTAAELISGRYVDLLDALDCFPYERQLPDRKETIVIVVGNGCKLKCQYCYVPGGTMRGVANIKKTLVEVLRSLDDESEVFVEFCGGLEECTGEIIKGIDLLRAELGSRVGFGAQSGGLDSTDCLLKLYSMETSLALSYDGSSPTRTRRTLHGFDSQDMVLEQIEALVGHGVPLLVRSTVTRESLKKGAEHRKRLADVGVERIILNRLRCAGRAFKMVAPTPAEFISYADEWLTEVLELGFPILADKYLIRWIYRLCGDSRGWVNFCSTGWCERRNRIRVFHEGPMQDCARHWTTFSGCAPHDVPVACAGCALFPHCKGGCRLDLRLGDGFECIYRKWIFNKVTGVVLTSPAFKPEAFGMVEV